MRVSAQGRVGAAEAGPFWETEAVTALEAKRLKLWEVGHQARGARWCWSGSRAAAVVVVEWPRAVGP